MHTCPSWRYTATNTSLSVSKSESWPIFMWAVQCQPYRSTKVSVTQINFDGCINSNFSDFPQWTRTVPGTVPTFMISDAPRYFLTGTACTQRGTLHAPRCLFFLFKLNRKCGPRHYNESYHNDSLGNQNTRQQQEQVLQCSMLQP